MSDIPHAIRGEIDQTPEWWDREYRALIQKRIPRDAAFHDGHSIEEWHTYTSLTVHRLCVDCGIEIDPYERGAE